MKLEASNQKSAVRGLASGIRLLASLLLCVFTLNAVAQTVLTADGLVALKKKASGAGGGGGGYVLKNHTAKGLGASGGTSSSIDSTGATLIIIGVVCYTTPGSVSDNKGNTWTAATTYGDATRHCTFYYCVNPTVGTGHTFSSTANLSSIFVLCFSGNASTPFDQQNGVATASTTTFQPGAVTPSQANEIVVSMVGYFSSASPATVNSSFTRVDFTDWAGGSEIAGAIGWKQQTTATSENPTWTIGASGDGAANIATFK